MNKNIFPKTENRGSGAFILFQCDAVAFWSPVATFSQKGSRRGPHHEGGGEGAVGPEEEHVEAALRLRGDGVVDPGHGGGTATMGDGMRRGSQEMHTTRSQKPRTKIGETNVLPKLS